MPRARPDQHPNAPSPAAAPAGEDHTSEGDSGETPVGEASSIRSRRIATEAEARALASAIRLRILRLCLDRALTNKEIAARLGANPATTLHHVRTLVATGFLRAEQERRGTRGSREVPYLATRKSWRLDTRASGVSGSGLAMLDAFLAEARLVDPDDVPYARLGLRLSPDGLTELQGRLDALLNEFAERADDPDGTPYSLFVALHPDRGRD